VLAKAHSAARAAAAQGGQQLHGCDVAQNWSAKKIFNELGVVQSYVSAGGPAPMEKDAFTWKGKGKFKGKGKGNEKGKSKGKGPRNGGSGTGKGQKGDQKGGQGKGKRDWSQQQTGSGGFQGNCDYCRKYDIRNVIASSTRRTWRKVEERASMFVRLKELMRVRLVLHRVLPIVPLEMVVQQLLLV